VLDVHQQRLKPGEAVLDREGTIQGRVLESHEGDGKCRSLYAQSTHSWGKLPACRTRTNPAPKLAASGHGG
jgi:hypothetical protein